MTANAANLDKVPKTVQTVFPFAIGGGYEICVIPLSGTDGKIWALILSHEGRWVGDIRFPADGPKGAGEYDPTLDSDLYATGIDYESEE
jgi:hypothetical protein